MEQNSGRSELIGAEQHQERGDWSRAAAGNEANGAQQEQVKGNDRGGNLQFEM